MPVGNQTRTCYLTQFRGFRIPGRKTLPVNSTQRADKGVAVVAGSDDGLVGAAEKLAENLFSDLMHSAHLRSMRRRILHG